MFKDIEKELQDCIDHHYGNTYKGFFKTQKGEYAENDIFIGIKVPLVRKIVRKYFLNISFEITKQFLYSMYHEYRLFALLVLVAKYQHSKTTTEEKTEIYNFYIQNIHQVNNWDLVDVTAPHIVGAYLYNRDKSILYTYSRSEELWLRRISIVSTFYFIKKGSFDDTFALAKILLNDPHDLIHKAVGWALRTIGDKEHNTLLDFLKPRYKMMPRTMLRYSIEKFDIPLRKKFLHNEF